MTGFFIGTKFLHRIGYLNTFRLSNIGMVLSLLFAVLFLNQIVAVSFLVSIFWGLSVGLFWGARHICSIRELGKDERGHLMNLLVSLSSVAEVALPLLSGSLISNQGYLWAFLLGAAVFAVGVMAPWKYNKRPTDVFSLQQLNYLAKRPGFRTYSGILLTDGFLVTLRDICLTILPFLLIGSELGVGILASFVALAGAIISFVHRRDNLKRKVFSGYIGASIITVFNLFLVTIWSLPALVVRGVGIKLGSSFFDPIDAQIDYYNSELLLGNFRQEGAVEMLVWREFLLFVGRIITVGVCILIILLVTLDIQVFLRIILVISAARELTALFRQARLNNKLHFGFRL